MALAATKKINKNSSPELSTRMKHLILSVEGDYEKKTIRQFVDMQLLARDARALRAYINSIQPDIDLDFEIEFALAQQDPNCVAHSGINRINASAVSNYLTGGVDYYGDGGEADETVLKDLSRWPETEYFNIWIVSEIENVF